MLYEENVAGRDNISAVIYFIIQEMGWLMIEEERECLLVISRTEERVKAARAEKQSVNIFAGTPNTENILI